MIHTLVFNLGRSFRKDKIKDKEYLVVPLVMLVEGVHAGKAFDAGSGEEKEGGFLYVANEMQKSELAWNHKPIIIYHPTKTDSKGVPVSGSDPETLSETQVGIVLNTRFDKKTKKLRAEAWLDEKELQAIAPAVLKNIKSGKPTEVSTGLQFDAENKEGEFNGVPYVAVAYNFRPDHLAILPKGVGACSIKKGAGLMVMNTGGSTETMEPEESDVILERAAIKSLERVGAVVVENSLSFSDTSRALSNMLGSKYGEKGKYWNGYIVEVFPEYCVFNNDNKYYAQPYTAKDTEVVLDGSAVEVKPYLTYVKVKDGSVYSLNEGTPNPAKEVAMNRDKFEAYLIQNCGFTAEELKGKTDDDLLALKPKTPAPVVAQNTDKKEELTWDQIEKLADSKTRQALKSARAAHDKEVKELVGVIVANENQPFTKEHLEELGASDIEFLRGIAHPYQIMAQNEGRGQDPRFRSDGPFGGAGGGIVHNTGRNQNVDDDDGDDDNEPVEDAWERKGMVRNGVVIHNSFATSSKKKVVKKKETVPDDDEE